MTWATIFWCLIDCHQTACKQCHILGTYTCISCPVRWKQFVFATCLRIRSMFLFSVLSNLCLSILARKHFTLKNKGRCNSKHFYKVYKGRRPLDLDPTIFASQQTQNFALIHMDHIYSDDVVTIIQKNSVFFEGLLSGMGHHA